VPSWVTLEDARRAAIAVADARGSPVALVQFNSRWFLEDYRPEYELGGNVVVVRPTTTEQVKQ